MAETTNLTTTITSEDYANLLYTIGRADRLAEAVAADWLASVGFSLNKPSDATLEALRKYDGFLHRETEKKAKEKEEEYAKRYARLLEKFANDPVHHLTPDSNPLRTEVGGLPDLEPKITCDSGNN